MLTLQAKALEVPPHSCLHHHGCRTQLQEPASLQCTPTRGLDCDSCRTEPQEVPSWPCTPAWFKSQLEIPTIRNAAIADSHGHSG